MRDTGGNISCTLGCWLVGLLGGILTAALLWVLGGWTFMQGAFMGLVVFGLAGLLLTWLLCRPLPAPNTAVAGHQGSDSAATSVIGLCCGRSDRGCSRGDGQQRGSG